MLMVCLLGGCLFPPTGASAIASPAFRDAVWHADLAQYGDRAGIDTSALSEGYVAVSATSATRLKFQVIMGEDTYTYDLPVDGTPQIFPLSASNARYLPHTTESGRTILPPIMYVSDITCNSL